MLKTKQNDWFWYELMTSDPDAAAKFYGDVVGWTFMHYPAQEGVPNYLVGNVPQRGVVGIMARPPEVPEHVKPHWIGYLYTEDADGTVKQVEEAGGSVLRAPFDMPTVGRIAVLADPEGGPFCVMKPGREETMPQLAMDTPGNVSWCELHSGNPEQNFAWYEKLFGWQRGEAMDMGPNGTYQMFTTNDQPVTGGSCGKMGDQATGWLYYFYVDGLDAAITRTAAGGGTIFMGPHQVPGGTWIAIGADPQGATFALHSATK